MTTTVCSTRLRRRLFNADSTSLLSAMMLLAWLIGAAAPSAASEEPEELEPVPMGEADPLDSTQWRLPRLGWDQTTADLFEYARVTVPDTDAETNHPALAGEMAGRASLIERSEVDGTVASSVANEAGQVGVRYASTQILSVTLPGAERASQDGGSNLVAFGNPGRIERFMEIIDYARNRGVVLSPAGNEGLATPTFPAGYLGSADGIKVEKAFQTISVAAAAPSTAAYGGTFDVAAVASSGLAVAITTSGICTGNGTGSATVTMTSGTGICKVHFKQGGDANYNAAPEATNGIRATKAQQIVMPTAAYASTFDVAAAASSGLPATITASGACAGSGSGKAIIAMTSGTGACTVHFNQEGDANYSAASEATYDITAKKADQSIEVTAAAPATAAYASTFDVTATASSTLAVDIAASGVCTGNGSGTATIAMTSGVGTCRLHFNQAGDSNFFAAAEVTETVTAEKATLTVSPKPSARQYGDRNPSLLPAYSGFAPGEGVGDLIEEPKCMTTAEATSPPGSYPITCTGGSASNYSLNHGDGAMLTVTPEEASIDFAADNPAAVKTNARDKYTWRLNLSVRVTEKQPDSATDGSAAGDIDTTDLTVTLTPLSAGGAIPLTCKAARVSGTGYGAVKTFTCSNRVSLGVDVYDVTAQAGGNYTGVAYDSVVVYGRGLGFANGGGWFQWPGTEDKTSFGFVMKEGKGDTGPEGTLQVVRHHADGTISRIKSDSLTGLVLQDDAASGCGNATFSGKVTYTTWDPSANSGLGGYVSTGGNPFMAYAEDCNNPGSGPDSFLIRSVGAIQMPPDAYSSKVPIAVDRGDIVVPHAAGKKK